RDNATRFELVLKLPPSCATESTDGKSHDQKSQVPQGQTEVPCQGREEENGEGDCEARDSRCGEEAEGGEEAGEGGGEKEGGAEEGPGAQAGGDEARRGAPRSGTTPPGTGSAGPGADAARPGADAHPGCAHAGSAVGRVVLRYPGIGAALE